MLALRRCSSQTSFVKTLSSLTKCGLVVIAAFCFCANQCDLKHNVVFLPDYATADQIILPGTVLSEADAVTLRRTLERSDENFYTIQVWKNGVKDGLPFGKLPFPKCLNLHHFTRSQGEEGFRTGISRTNASRWSRVIGMACQSRCNRATVRAARQQARASQDLVNAVKPILLRYQKE
jgi:hypothetical protein